MTRSTWWKATNSRRNGAAGRDGKWKTLRIRPSLELLEDRITPSTLIPVTDRQALVYDPIRNILDITTNSGTVQQFSIASQQLLTPITVGTHLRGADITPDGSALYVTDTALAPGATQGVLHKVNLSTQAVTNLTYTLAAGGEGGSWDVSIGSDGLGLMTTVFQGSGWTPLHQLDLSTDTLTVRIDDPGSGGRGQVRGDTLIRRGAGRGLLFLTEADISSGPIFTYNAAANSFGPAGDTNEEFLINRAAAVSRDGSLIALQIGTGVAVIDPNLNAIVNLGHLDGGVAFDPAQDVLYGVNTHADQIVAYDTHTWTIKYSLPIGEAASPYGQFSNGEMVVTNDGSRLFLSTSSGVREFNLPSPTGVASSLTLTGYPSFILGGVAGSFTVTARDPAGNIATGYTGTVHFTSSDGGAGLPMDYTFISADHGVHTFQATFSAAGTQSLTATDQADSVEGSITGITVHTQPASLIPVVSASRDLIYDQARGLLYITTDTGTIQRYDIVHQTLLAPFVVGASLKAADITADDSFLYVTDTQPSAVQGLYYKINLNDGSVTNLTYNLAFAEGGSFDLATTSRGTALADGTFKGSGWTPLRQIDLTTDAITKRIDGPGSGGSGQVRQNTLIWRSADRGLLFFTEANISSGPIFTYNATTDTFGQATDTFRFLDHVLSAVNRNGTLIALGNTVMDQNFNVITTVNGNGGVAFDPLQDVLYAADPGSDQIIAYDTTTWQQKFTINIGETISGGSAFGSGMMTVSDDGRWLFLTTASGVRVFSLNKSDISVTNTDNTALAVPGTSTTYTIVVTNTGATTATSLAVSNPLPAGVISATWSGNGQTNVSGPLSDTIASLAPGDSVTYTFTVEIDPSAIGSLTSIATVSVPPGNTTPGDVTARDVDTLTPQSDVAITVTDNTGTAIPGTSTTYTIVVTNSGPSAAGGLLVTDPLPSGATSATWTGGGHTNVSGALSDTISSLAPGASITYTFTVQIGPSAAGSLTDTATVAIPPGDTTSGDNTATDVDTLMPEADVSITNSDNAGTAAPGGSTTYTIVVSNSGPSTATALSVNDPLPTGVTSATWSGNGHVNVSGALSDMISSLVPGTPITYTFIVHIDPAATGSLTNTATISIPAGDNTPDDNTASDSDTLSPQSDVSITTSDHAALAIPGTATSYTVVVTNSGPSPAAGLIVSDPLPAGVSSAVWSGNGHTNVSGPLSDNIVSLAAGASVTYTFTVQIDPSATGSLTDTAMVTIPPGDHNTSNNTATDVDSLTPQSDVSIANTDNAATAGPGSATTYTIVVTNSGPSTAAGLVVSDALPGGVDSALWSGDGHTNVSGALSDTISGLAPRASLTYTFTVQIDVAATGSLTNTATVSTPPGDNTQDDNTATDTDTLTSGPVSLARSMVTIDPGMLDELHTATVTLIAQDANGTPEPKGGLIVAFHLDGGTAEGTFSAVTDNHDGTYTAIFTATLSGVNTVGATINDQPVTSTPPSVIVRAGAVTVTGADLGAQPWVNVYDAATGQLALHFLAYESSFRGGVRVALADLNRDGVPEIITAPGGVQLHVNSDLSAYTDTSLGRAPEVKVFSITGQLLYDFLAYNPSFKAGLFVAAGTLNGQAAIVTGPGISAPDVNGLHISPASLGNPDVRVFLSSDLINNGGPLAPDREFLAYAAGVQSGVRVAVADVTGDGVPDIVTVPGPLSGADVRIFDGKALLNSNQVSRVGEFAAYDPTKFFGGLNVALGDVNGDGRPDIVTGVNGYGGPEVKIFDGKSAGGGSPTPTVIDDFMAFNQNTFNAGVRVAAADVNGDGKAEVIVGSGPGGIRIGNFPLDPDVERGGLSEVQVFDVSRGQPTPLPGDPGGFSPYTFPQARDYAGGVFVAAIGSGFMPLAAVSPSIFTATGADLGAQPWVNVYDATTGQLRLHFLAYESTFRGGVRVAVADINGDGIPDIVTAPGGVQLHVNSNLSAYTDTSLGRAPEVKVFSGLDGSLMADFLAYNSAFKAGVFVAVGNLDGHPDIVTGPDISAPDINGMHVSPASLGNPDVRVFFSSHLINTGAALAPDREFLAYAAGVQSGVRVAVADVTGDGVPDIVTVPGPLSGADVRIFDGKALVNGNHVSKAGEFAAYDPTKFFGGLNVALGDVNGDGRPDIITGVNGYGGPEVKVFDGKSAGGGSPSPTVIDDFMAFNQVTFNAGVRVAAVDVNGDGKSEVIVGSGPGGIRIGDFPLDPDVERGGLSEVEVWDLSSGLPLILSGIMGSFSPYTFAGFPDYAGGVFIGASETSS